VPVYRRRLPHIYQIGEPLFVTWRLAGSLPANRPFLNADLTNGQAFAAFDRLLDTARTGPLLLKQPALAGIVMSYLMQLARIEKVCDLHAFAVMPNHVHVLLTPHIPLSQIMKLAKGGSARLANQALGNTGSTFWQDESYDHFVRDRDEFRRIQRYIEFNPVRAGLAAAPEDYPFSSASRGWGEVSTEPRAGLKPRAD
jgi:REP element-mobilizing transposase RayT